MPGVTFYGQSYKSLRNNIYSGNADTGFYALTLFTKERIRSLEILMCEIINKYAQNHF